jgi:hypothetical protein
MRLNMSIDTDPQQQEAASPQMLVVRSFSRYPSGFRTTVAALDMTYEYTYASAHDQSCYC